MTLFLSKSVTYDDIGNIIDKSDVGMYSYNNHGQVLPHAVVSVSGTVNASYAYDANGNMTSDGSRAVSWTAANMVAQIVQGTTVVGFAYDTDHARLKKTSTDGTSSATTTYYRGAGLMVEKVVYDTGNVQWNDYIQADGRMVAEHFRLEDSQGALLNEYLRYFVTDHLGSIAVITDETGAVVERLSYDAWGMRRDPDGADALPGAITSETTRGYTGHEMIDEVALINMNGRIQDPRIGRFLSADPTIQNVFNMKSLNRFSYVWNIPRRRHMARLALQSNKDLRARPSVVKGEFCFVRYRF